MARHLILVLEAPLMSFGREAVDARGQIGDFPAASLLTGLLANALGWRREQRALHAALQARLVFAARLDRPGSRLTDFQTARLSKDDRGWTSLGVPEGRAGGSGTYNAPHIRKRDYDGDKRVTVALRLEPPTEAPDLDALAAALRAPARPLFLGRKSCLPAGPLLDREVEAETLLTALAQAGCDTEAPQVLLPAADAAAGPDPHDQALRVSDLRNWISGVHEGSRAVVRRRLTMGTKAPA